MTSSPDFESYVEGLNSGGSPLPNESKSFFESTMGYDFSEVRIHNDSKAAESAQNINALAYTSGNNIIFNQNQYQPNSETGKKLLAHELTHTLQQTGTIQRKCSVEEKDNEITGVGKDTKYLKRLPEAGSSNLPGVPVVDGDKVVVRNTGGAAGYHNIKNCSWAWVEIPGKKSTDPNYKVLHGFIETKYLLSKEVKKEEPQNAPSAKNILSSLEGPEIVHAGGTFEYTASVAGTPEGSAEISNIKWSFQFDQEAVTPFDLTKGVTVDGTNVTLNAYIPEGKKAGKIKIFAYNTTLQEAATKVSSMQAVSFVESKKDKGKNTDGTIADDLTYGDYTEDQISDLGTMFSIDVMNNFTDEQLFEHLKSMATTFFSVGELETNVLAMIEHFKENTGNDYSSPVLTKAVKEHAATKVFIDHVKVELSKKVLAEREALAQTAVNKGAIEKYRPIFNSSGDTFAGGLTFAINDTWAYSSQLKYYDFKSDTDFKGTLKISLFDDFGLDKPDVMKKFGYLMGFRAWFILQHQRGFKPFITVVEFDVDFDQSITEIEGRLAAEAQRKADEAEAYKKSLEASRIRGPKI